ncbi:hypothetical protein GCM10010399_64070 [Dactylosporangium fulvum]
MATADGRWRVRVGGVGAVRWYRLEGDGVRRDLPSLAALATAADEHGVDIGELREVEAAAP